LAVLSAAATLTDLSDPLIDTSKDRMAMGLAVL
jgi:hypothetical protein